MALFQRLNRERGMTVMLVTHEPDVAAHARRLVSFRDGIIVVRRARAREGTRMIGFMQTLRLALQALVRNRSRSLLTMLGVVIGVAAVIVTVAIGTGAKTSVANQINGLGSNLVIVIPGSVQTSGARTGNGGASTLTVQDGLAIAKLPGVSAVSPAVNVRTQLIANGQNWQTTATGVAPTYTVVRSWDVVSGRFFTQAETDDAAKVAVLGQTVVKQLFADGSNPIGRTVLVKNVPFTVIGMLSAKGQSGAGQDQDDTVLIPYTSALERLTGGTTIGTLMVSAVDGDHIAVGAVADHRAARAAPRASRADSRTTSRCATCRTSRKPLRRRRRSSGCCSPRSRPCRCSSAGSAS